MSEFTCDINIKSKSDNRLELDIKGNNEYGLDKTIINAIRRTLLSSIETYAFRTSYENSDITIEVNNTSLHNEYILDRIGLIPLYLDPNLVDDNPTKYNPLRYLFVLNIKHDNSEPVRVITAKDFEIYELKDTIMKSSDYLTGSIKKVNKDNYDLTKKLPDKIKEEVFRPFRNKYYSIITETKSTNSDENVQELVLYGSPSVSIAKEDARWQSVSCATYSFKTDTDLVERVLKEKISIENPENIDEFKNEFVIGQAARYYHRDNNSEPYWYNFDIESQHYLDSKELFIRANEIIIESLDYFKDRLDEIVEGEDIPYIKFIFNDNNVINILIDMPPVITEKVEWHGFDDTLGSIIQAHISNKLIKEGSLLNLCGYKRTHPLENRMLFTLSMNNNDETEELEKRNSIIQVFKDCCDELKNIYEIIIKGV
jgi:DNA-directed RNA polymerase subunit L